MLYNIYTYLFVSTVLFGAFNAIILRILREPGKRDRWDALSHILLIQVMTGLTLIIFGLLIADAYPVSFIEPLLFFVSFLLIFSLLFVLLGNLTILLSAVVVVSLFLLFQISLREYTPVKESYSIGLTVLRRYREELIIEICEPDKDCRYVSIEGSVIYPYIIQLSFLQELFFLPSSTYVKFLDLVPDLNTVNINNDKNFSLPEFLYNSSITITDPLPGDILSGVTLNFPKNGSVIIERKP